MARPLPGNLVPVMNANDLLERVDVLEDYRRIAERLMEPELVTTLDRMIDDITMELRSSLEVAAAPSRCFAGVHRLTRCRGSGGARSWRR